MWKPDWLIRDINKRSFKWWIKYHKDMGGEEAELAEQLEANVPVVFALFHPEVTLDNLDHMSFRDVKLRLAVIEKRLEQQKKSMEIPLPSRSNSIVNTAVE